MISNTNINPVQTARVAGVLYLLLFPLGIFGILYVPSSLVVLGDMAATSANIIENKLLFRLSILAALVVQLINILLVVALYHLLKSVHKTQAMFMLIFSLIAVPIAMLNELNQFAVLILLSGVGHLNVFTSEQLQAMVLVLFELHGDGINIAQIFWGLWLGPMGYLIFKSKFLPKFLGVLMVIGCLGYVLDSVLYIVYPGIDVKVSAFTFLGELLLPLWLLIKGIDEQQWQKGILKSTTLEH